MRAWLTSGPALKAACIPPLIPRPIELHHLRIESTCIKTSCLLPSVFKRGGQMTRNLGLTQSVTWIFDWSKMVAIPPMDVCRLFTIRLIKIAATLLRQCTGAPLTSCNLYHWSPSAYNSFKRQEQQFCDTVGGATQLSPYCDMTPSRQVYQQRSRPLLF